jgi:hypothetical protein
LKEMRAIFDWMAQEKGAVAIASRKFKERVPELHRRMPQVASSFRRMDANGDCYLEWSEFVEFCLKDDLLTQQMKHYSVVSVYARERGGVISYKDALDPHRQCEVGTIPPLLPWEISHVVEWRIEHLVTGPTRGHPVTHGSTVVRPGISLASPPFRAAAVSGFLRFYPSGYYTEAQRRIKVKAAAPTQVLRSSLALHSPELMTWLAMSLLPQGDLAVVVRLVKMEACVKASVPLWPQFE